MKRLWLLTFIFISALSANAQITFETTYNGWAYLVQLDVSGYKYCYIDVQSQKFKIHNTDHSLWKQVNLIPPAGYVISTNAYCVSENLFSLDNKVCFIYTYYTYASPVQYEAKVVNEDGQTLLTIPDCNYAYVYSAENDGAKLLANCINYTTNVATTKVYDLPGHLNTMLMENPAGIPMHSFPNPAGEFIFIPIPENSYGETVHVSIRNLSGKMVCGYEMQSTGNLLKVNTRGLDKGVCLISIKHDGDNIYNDQFIIQ